VPPLNLADLELELIDILSTQGLPVEEIRLIGLLGKGNRAMAFSVTINGVYHVLKVYDSRDSLRAELKNLKKVTPKDRFLFAWEERLEDNRKTNLAIIEVPEGHAINSSLLNEASITDLTNQVVTLHRLRYRQKVSYTALKQQLKRVEQPFLKHIELMGRDPKRYRQLLSDLDIMLTSSPDLFRTNKVRVHGDLWWPNVIAASEGVYLIDWESVHRGDAAEDIAKLRTTLHFANSDARSVFFWRDVIDSRHITNLMKQILARHQELGDDTLPERLRFYLSAACIDHLTQRYLVGDTLLAIDQAVNGLVADEALRLFEDPLATPDLSSHNYFAEVSAASLGRP